MKTPQVASKSILFRIFVLWVMAFQTTFSPLFLPAAVANGAYAPVDALPSDIFSRQQASWDAQWGEYHRVLRAQRIQSELLIKILQEGKPVGYGLGSAVSSVGDSLASRVEMISNLVREYNNQLRTENQKLSKDARLDKLPEVKGRFLKDKVRFIETELVPKHGQLLAQKLDAGTVRMDALYPEGSARRLPTQPAASQTNMVLTEGALQKVIRAFEGGPKAVQRILGSDIRLQYMALNALEAVAGPRGNHVRIVPGQSSYIEEINSHRNLFAKARNHARIILASKADAEIRFKLATMNYDPNALPGREFSPRGLPSPETVSTAKGHYTGDNFRIRTVMHNGVEQVKEVWNKVRGVWHRVDIEHMNAQTQQWRSEIKNGSSQKNPAELLRQIQQMSEGPAQKGRLRQAAEVGGNFTLAASGFLLGMSLIPLFQLAAAEGAQGLGLSDVPGSPRTSEEIYETLSKWPLMLGIYASMWAFLAGSQAVKMKVSQRTSMMQAIRQVTSAQNNGRTTPFMGWKSSFETLKRAPYVPLAIAIFGIQGVAMPYYESMQACHQYVQAPQYSDIYDSLKAKCERGWEFWQRSWLKAAPGVAAIITSVPIMAALGATVRGVGAWAGKARTAPKWVSYFGQRLGGLSSAVGKRAAAGSLAAWNVIPASIRATSSYIFTGIRVAAVRGARSAAVGYLVRASGSLARIGAVVGTGALHAIIFITVFELMNYLFKVTTRLESLYLDVSRGFKENDIAEIHQLGLDNSYRCDDFYETQLDRRCNQQINETMIAYRRQAWEARQVRLERFAKAKATYETHIGGVTQNYLGAFGFYSLILPELKKLRSDSRGANGEWKGSPYAPLIQLQSSNIESINIEAIAKYEKEKNPLLDSEPYFGISQSQAAVLDAKEIEEENKERLSTKSVEEREKEEAALNATTKTQNALENTDASRSTVEDGIRKAVKEVADWIKQHKNNESIVPPTEKKAIEEIEALMADPSQSKNVMQAIEKLWQGLSSVATYERYQMGMYEVAKVDRFTKRKFRLYAELLYRLAGHPEIPRQQAIDSKTRTLMQERDMAEAVSLNARFEASDLAYQNEILPHYMKTDVSEQTEQLKARAEQYAKVSKDFQDQINLRTGNVYKLFLGSFDDERERVDVSIFPRPLLPGEMFGLAVAPLVLQSYYGVNDTPAYEKHNGMEFDVSTDFFLYSAACGPKHAGGAVPNESQMFKKWWKTDPEFYPPRIVVDNAPELEICKKPGWFKSNHDPRALYRPIKDEKGRVYFGVFDYLYYYAKTNLFEDYGFRKWWEPVGQKLYSLIGTAMHSYNTYVIQDRLVPSLLAEGFQFHTPGDSVKESINEELDFYLDGVLMPLITNLPATSIAPGASYFMVTNSDGEKVPGPLMSKEQAAAIYQEKLDAYMIALDDETIPDGDPRLKPVEIYQSIPSELRVEEETLVKQYIQLEIEALRRLVKDELTSSFNWKVRLQDGVPYNPMSEAQNLMVSLRKRFHVDGNSILNIPMAGSYMQRLAKIETIQKDPQTGEYEYFVNRDGKPTSEPKYSKAWYLANMALRGIERILVEASYYRKNRTALDNLDDHIYGTIKPFDPPKPEPLSTDSPMCDIAVFSHLCVPQIQIPMTDDLAMDVCDGSENSEFCTGETRVPYSYGHAPRSEATEASDVPAQTEASEQMSAPEFPDDQAS